MVPRAWRVRLEDMLEAIIKIQHYTASVDKNTFFANAQLLDTVTYNFIVLGEAAGHIPEDIQVRYPQVAWRDIRDMRNFLAHEYAKTDSQVLWQTIHEDLLPLVPVLEHILTESKPKTTPDNDPPP